LGNSIKKTVEFSRDIHEPIIFAINQGNMYAPMEKTQKKTAGVAFFANISESTLE